MNTADDWTKEMSTKGFPELQKLYAAYGKKDNVFLKRGEHFPHNYNAVTRSAFYTFLNRHFKLGQPSPVIERDFEPLRPEQLTVWDERHPAPRRPIPSSKASCSSTSPPMRTGKSVPPRRRTAACRESSGPRWKR